MLKKVHIQGLVISLIASSLLAACSGKRGFKPMPIKGADPLTITKADPADPGKDQPTTATQADPQDLEARTRQAPIVAELREEDKRVISETLEVKINNEQEVVSGVKVALDNFEKSVDKNDSALAGKVLGLSLKKYVVKNGTAAADFSEAVGIHVKTLVNEKDGILSDRFFEGTIQLSGGKDTQFVLLNEVRPEGQSNVNESSIKVFARCQQEKCKSLRILVDATTSEDKPMAASYHYIADESNALEMKYVGSSLGSAYMSYEEAYEKFQNEGVKAHEEKSQDTDGKDLSAKKDGEGDLRAEAKQSETAKSQESGKTAEEMKTLEQSKPVGEGQVDAEKVEVQSPEKKNVVRTDNSDADGQTKSVVPNGEGADRIDQKSEVETSSANSFGETPKDRSARLFKKKQLEAQMAAERVPGEKPKDRQARQLKEKQQAQIERNNQIAKAYAAELANRKDQVKSERPVNFEGELKKFDDMKAELIKKAEQAKEENK